MSYVLLELRLARAAHSPEEAERLLVAKVRLKPSLFDERYYLEQNEGMDLLGLAPYEHFVRTGLSEGREARFFDPIYYLWRNRDVLRAGLDPFPHYKTTGRSENRPARFVAPQFRDTAQHAQSYKLWYARHAERRKEAVSSAAADALASSPLISVVMPTYNSDIAFLDAAISSVLSQSYGKFELCIADDNSPDPQVRERILHWAALDPRVKHHFRTANGHISAATNSAIAMASGRYIAFMDHDDELAEDALACVARRLAAHPDCLLLYSDEDKIDERGELSSPHFKSDFNYELLLAQNYINHLTVVRADEVRRLGGLREGFEGAQDYDFLLRLCRTIPRTSVHHIPEVLYHWRMTSSSTAASGAVKPYVEAAGVRALTDHCREAGLTAEVFPIREYGYYRVQYAIMGEPKVSIIIPTRDRLELLRQCIDSLLANTTYKNYEIIIADNDSSEARTLRYFEDVEKRGVRVVRCPGDFNFSRINNQAAAAAQGDHLLLLNNDIEVISGDWLTEMLRYAQMPDVGCVGARLWYPDKTLQHGGVIVGIRGVAGHAHKYLQMGGTGYFCRAVLPQQLSAVTAACLLVKKSVFFEVGGLDESLAVAFNDVDFCLRVDAAGLPQRVDALRPNSSTMSPSHGARRTPGRNRRASARR